MGSNTNVWRYIIFLKCPDVIKKCLQWWETWRGSRRWAESESGVCFEHLGETGRWSLLIAEPESLTVSDFRWPLSRSLSPSHPAFWLSTQALMACTCPALLSAAFFQQTLHQSFRKSAHVRSDCLVFPHPVPFFFGHGASPISEWPTTLCRVFPP